MVSLLPTRRLAGLPIGTMLDVTRELDRFLGELDGNGADIPTGTPGAWVPPMDIVETETEIRCQIEVPGVAREDLDISVQGNLLRVAGAKKSARTEGATDGAYRLFERRYGGFERQLTLPERVDGSRISAHYEDGVLTLVLPKTAEAKPRQIPIAGAEARRGVHRG